MYTVLVVVQVLVAIALIGLVLIQHGKGADAGAAFGSGASGTVFGARGAANFLTRTTAVLAAAFFVASLALAYLVHDRGGDAGRSVVDDLEGSVMQPADPADVPALPSSDEVVVPEESAAPAESTDPLAPVVPE